MAVLLFACDGPRSAARNVVESIRFDSLWVLSADWLNRVYDIEVGTGRVLINNAGNGEIVAVAIADNRAITVGRMGAGPGEFQSVTHMRANGNEVLVLDALSRRLHSYFLSDTSVHAESWELPRDLGTPDQVLAVHSGGIMIAFLSGPPRPGSVPEMRVIRDSIVIVEIARERGREPRIVLSIPGAEYFVGVNESRARWIARPAFGTSSFVALAANGVVMADGRTGEVHLLRYDGSHHLVLRDYADTMSVAADELAKYVNAVDLRAARIGDGGEYAAMARMAVDVWGRVPPRPHYENVVSDGKTAYVQKYEFGNESPEQWVWLDVETGLMGEFMLPQRHRLIGVTGDTLVLVTRDSLDVESVLLLRARRSEKAP